MVAVPDHMENIHQHQASSSMQFSREREELSFLKPTLADSQRGLCRPIRERLEIPRAEVKQDIEAAMPPTRLPACPSAWPESEMNKMAGIIRGI